MPTPTTKLDGNQEQHFVHALNKIADAINQNTMAMNRLFLALTEADRADVVNNYYNIPEGSDSGSPEQVGPAAPLTGDGQG